MATNNQVAMSTLEPKPYNDATGKPWFSFVVNGLEAMEAECRNNAKDDQQFLDLACGPGDITRDGLLPRCLPCRRVVAVDVSRDMVEYAKTHFGHPKICYDVLDIVGDNVADFVERYGRFDRVYSFYCFHWVKNQEKAFKNVAKLMKPGAECLLWFFADSPPIRFRQKLAKMEHWKKYAEIFENCIPPTVDMSGKNEVISYVSYLLRSANLTPSICKVSRETIVMYTRPDIITQALMTFNPLTTLLTEEEKSCLLDEATKEATRLWTEQEACGSPMKFDVVVVRASKPGP